jgi:hypothetical protein
MVGARDYDWRSSVALPPGSVVERLPPPVEIGNEAGRFSVSYETTAEGFSQQRRLVLDRDVYAAEDYPALEALLYAQIDAQRSVVVYRPPQ